MDIYDIISIANFAMAFIAVILMVKLAIKYKALRVVYGLIALFCLYGAGVYGYILMVDPDLGLQTAALGRTALTLLLAAIIMFAIILDK